MRELDVVDCNPAREPSSQHRDFERPDFPAGNGDLEAILDRSDSDIRGQRDVGGAHADVAGVERGQPHVDRLRNRKRGADPHPYDSLCEVKLAVIGRCAELDGETLLDPDRA